MKTIATAMLTTIALALAACGGGGGNTTGGDTTAPSGATGAATGTGIEAGPSARSPVKRGGDSGGQAGSGAQAKSKSQARDQDLPADTSASFTPPVHQDSPTGAAPFETKGGDNSIQEFGAEGSGSDFEAAASALHGYLDARAAAAWTAACSYLSAAAATSLSQLTGTSGSGGEASCPEALASLSAGVPAAILEEAAEAEVGALRTEGDRAFLIFRGAGGTDYFMPMAREGGAWKVAAIAPSALP